jgi:hypothetical protein
VCPPSTPDPVHSHRVSFHGDFYAQTLNKRSKETSRVDCAWRMHKRHAMGSSYASGFSCRRLVGPAAAARSGVRASACAPHLKPFYLFVFLIEAASKQLPVARAGGTTLNTTPERPTLE